MNKIYLAGPITGCSWNESEDWRDEFKGIKIPNVECFSPLRGKQYLQHETQISDRYDEMTMSSAKAIMSRDFFDVSTSAAIVVNLRNAKRVSIGTVMEIAWAYQRRIPIIAILEKENIHNHSMLDEALNWRVETVGEAATIVYQIFNA